MSISRSKPRENPLGAVRTDLPAAAPETPDRLQLLFSCVHDSARSQMAEGLLRSIAADRFEVFSAGSEPTFVNPFAARVLRDEGIDISRLREAAPLGLLTRRALMQLPRTRQMPFGKWRLV